jgi:hypothetical protein
MDGFLLKLTGTVTVASAWHINDVVLPFGPSGVKVNGGVNKQTMAKAGDEPVQIVEGKSGSTLTLSGSLEDDSKTDVQLWEDVITPLLELQGSEVTLVCPITGLNGTYLLEAFEPSRDKFHPIYDYTMRLTKSSLNVILASDD